MVHGSLDLGGCERQALLLARHLREREGAEVHFVGLGGSRDGKVAELCRADGLPCIWAGIFWAAPGRRQRLQGLWALRRLLRMLRPDVLLPYTAYANIMCGLVWRFTQARACIWTQRNEGRLLDGGRLERLAVKCTPAFMSNSEHAVGLLRQLYAIPRERISVIRNGVELAAPRKTRDEWRESLRVGSDTPMLCMVANLTAYKDHATLLRAWRVVLDQWQDRRPPVLALAGRPAERAEALKALAFDLDLGRSVRFLGLVDDVSGLLAACDLGAFSSMLEGLPNGVLECMATGLAVAGTDIPGVREAVGPEGVPFLASPGDATQLADRIMALAQNAGRRREVGTHMRRRIDKEFSPERMCRSMVDLIGESLERGRI